MIGFPDGGFGPSVQLSCAWLYEPLFTSAEVGVRTVAIPHLQSTASLWTLHLDSELVYDGNVGATVPGPASDRHGVEWTNYYSPRKWLMFDGDVSWSRAYFSGVDAVHRFVPEAVGVVVSAGASVDNFHRAFGSVRMRYFGDTTPASTLVQVVHLARPEFLLEIEVIAVVAP